VVAVIACSAASAGAPLIDPISQSRSVYADALADGIRDTQTSDATAFEPFNASAEAQASGAESSAGASAFQNSQIGADSVTAQGDVSVSATGELADANASSDFEFNFIFDRVVEYDFDASVMPDPGGGTAAVWLIDVSRGETLAEIQTAGQTHVMATGLLDPGEYRLQAFASALDSGDLGHGGNTGFNFFFTVPEPGITLLQLCAIAALGGLGLRRGGRAVGIVQAGPHAR